jgi:hypothetical protein
MLFEEQQIGDDDVGMATASRAVSSACGFSPHSAAAWTVTVSPGKSPARSSVARAAGPAACESSVTIATR